MRLGQTPGCVILLRDTGRHGTLRGLILVHTVFGMPIAAPLFRNHFARLPEGLLRAAHADGAGCADHLIRLRQTVRVQHRRGCRQGLIRQAFRARRDLTLNFAAVPMWTSLNLDVDRGDFIGLPGPSGCGKSTLLSFIAGLLDYPTGRSGRGTGP